ncbi:hypothetical protein M0811_00640 [Anaeramoeba ignava]|uniref:Uncharacterized protein n=1 Tax=Anaeramoeba ignava TaxID=1746090 RepID=A0A9Q0LJF2_ANAIG|nr:hypothetical protein M0811_00640 [Anaeramoeba ignava]
MLETIKIKKKVIRIFSLGIDSLSSKTQRKSALVIVTSAREQHHHPFKKLNNISKELILIINGSTFTLPAY